MHHRPVTRCLQQIFAHAVCCQTQGAWSSRRSCRIRRTRGLTPPVQQVPVAFQFLVVAFFVVATCTKPCVLARFVATSTRCMQFRVVACNIVFLHAISCCCMQFLPLTSNNNTIHHAAPRTSSGQANSSHGSPPCRSLFLNMPLSRICPFHRLCGNCEGLPKLSLKNVFLRGFVNMWWTFPFHESSSSSLLCPRSQARPNLAAYRGTGFSLFR